jgi:alpha-tubulin suppressor-like RCC1 family protein
MRSFSSLTPCTLPAALAAALFASAACREGQLLTSPAAPETATFSIAAAGVEFAYVSAGNAHSCGLTTGGAAYCWGLNSRGQLGDATNTNSNVPVAVSGSHTFASVGVGSSGHSCGVTTAGVAYCWGNNDSGELGDGTNNASSVPVAVSGGHTFASVSAGDAHTCGVTTAGAAYCWGANGIGQVGDGTNINSNVPVAVSGGYTFASVSAGLFHSCGVTTAGAAYCWGFNKRGQLGNATNTASNVPVVVSGGYTFASVSAGWYHSCGVTTVGAAYCWGANFYGELGNGANSNSNVPVAVSGGLTFASVSAGSSGHSCGVTTSGAAYCWGWNFYAQLGNGTRTDSNVPAAVSGSHLFASVSAGFLHSCGVTTDGTGSCWGDNFYGQLGNGTNIPSSVPRHIQRN